DLRGVHFFLPVRRAPGATLFPYTTLFRSREDAEYFVAMNRNTVLALLDEIERMRRERKVLAEVLRHVYTCDHCECALIARIDVRSEEHTSELQSRENLVCRLLLEKKHNKE